MSKKLDVDFFSLSDSDGEKKLYSENDNSDMETILPQQQTTTTTTTPSLESHDCYIDDYDDDDYYYEDFDDDDDYEDSAYRYDEDDHVETTLRIGYKRLKKSHCFGDNNISNNNNNNLNNNNKNLNNNLNNNNLNNNNNNNNNNSSTNFINIDGILHLKDLDDLFFEFIHLNVYDDNNQYGITQHRDKCTWYWYESNKSKWIKYGQVNQLELERAYKNNSIQREIIDDGEKVLVNFKLMYEDRGKEKHLIKRSGGFYNSLYNFQNYS